MEHNKVPSKPGMTGKLCDWTSIGSKILGLEQEQIDEVFWWKKSSGKNNIRTNDVMCEMALKTLQKWVKHSCFTSSTEFFKLVSTD